MADESATRRRHTDSATRRRHNESATRRRRNDMAEPARKCTPRGIHMGRRVLRLQCIVAFGRALLVVAAEALVMPSAVAGRLAVLLRASVWMSRWLAHDGFRSCGSLECAGRRECFAEQVVGR